MIAAHRAGLRHICLPARNEKDLTELPASVLAGMSFTLVNEVAEVLQAALLPLDQPAEAAAVGDARTSNFVVEERPRMM